MSQQTEIHNRRSKTLPSESSRGMASRTFPSMRVRGRRNTEGAMLERDVCMDDLVIAVMGPTGAGKSNFIMKLIGSDGQQEEFRISSTGLKSHTSDIKLIRILNNPTYGDRIVIVDTPGFDDTYKSDMEILTIIGKWLEQTYKGQVRLAGLFYLHRISDNRMAGSPKKNLAMFKRLTGDTAAQRVVFVTTMWDVAKDESRRETFKKRTEQLMSIYWKDTLEAGAQQAPFDNTHDAALKCMNLILPTYSDAQNLPQTTTLNIQEELVNGGKRINETDAGRELYSSLQTTLHQTRKTLQDLREQAREAGDHETVRRLERDIAVTESQLERAFQDVNVLRIPWWRKAYLTLPQRARTILNKLSRHEMSIEVASPLSSTSPSQERRRWTSPMLGDSWRSRRITDIEVDAPQMAPQISERNYAFKQRFREGFRGTVLSIPQTPTSGLSDLASELRDFIVGRKKDVAERALPLHDPSSLASPVTSESPKSISTSLPGPGPSCSQKKLGPQKGMTVSFASNVVFPS